MKEKKGSISKEPTPLTLNRMTKSIWQPQSITILNHNIMIYNNNSSSLGMMKDLIWRMWAKIKEIIFHRLEEDLEEVKNKVISLGLSKRIHQRVLGQDKWSKYRVESQDLLLKLCKILNFHHLHKEADKGQLAFIKGNRRDHHLKLMMLAEKIVQCRGS